MTNDKTSDRLRAFAPGWCDPGLLEATLIGRRDLVDRYEKLVIEGAGGPNKFQRLVVGPRGSGKTHILRVLLNRLRVNDALQSKLLVVCPLEDEMGVATFFDFIVRVLNAILRDQPNEYPQLKKRVDELYDLRPNERQSAIARILLEMAGKRGILLLLENLDILFDSKHGFGLDGQRALRDFVQTNPRVMVFATSQALSHGVRSTKGPFYKFFTVDHLQPLSFSESLGLLRAMAEQYEDSRMLQFLASQQGRGRARAIHEFPAATIVFS